MKLPWSFDESNFTLILFFLENNAKRYISSKNLWHHRKIRTWLRKFDEASMTHRCNFDEALMTAFAMLWIINGSIATNWLIILILQGLAVKYFSFFIPTQHFWAVQATNQSVWARLNSQSRIFRKRRVAKSAHSKILQAATAQRFWPNWQSQRGKI